MKVNPVLLFLTMLFLSTTGFKKDEDCHYDLVFQNNSSQPVIIVQVSPKINNDSCSFFGEVSIVPNQNIKYNIITSRCIEKHLKSGQGFAPTYFIDPMTNIEKAFKCDSVYSKNKILKEVVFDLDELKASNFTINYP